MKGLKKILLLLMVVVHSGITAQKLAAPEIRCVSVLPGGAVEITWNSISDPGSQFLRYDLYDASGLLLTGIPNIATTTHVHAGAGADVSSQGYYLQAVATNSAFSSDLGDTVYSLLLDVVNPGNGEAWLFWNKMHEPNLSGASDYQIYREFPAGNWTLIGTQTYGNENFTDTIDICNTLLNYQVVVQNGGCESESNIDGDVFQDVIAPATPVMSFVSVDTATGNVIIDWDPSSSADAVGYILMKFIPTLNWVVLDTVWGYGNTIYTDIGATPGIDFQNYGVAAFDSCISPSTGTPNTSPLNTPHRTIHQTFNALKCDLGIQLNWSAYLNWPGGVSTYEVYGCENGGPWTLFGSTTGLSLDITGLTSGSNYCFVVRAVSMTGVESLSNKICYVVYQPTVPAYGYLATASVNGDNVRIRYFGDVTNALKLFKVERATQPGGPFNAIGYQPIAGPLSEFVDATADPYQRDYYYRAVAIDSCDNESIVSNVVRTMHLTVKKNDYNLQNTLNWNPFEGWDGNVVSYNVYRSINGIFNPIPIASLPPGTTDYVDDVNQVLETNGEFCYYIEAVEDVNSYGLSETSRSNAVCVYMETMVWIPNAIVLNGVNQVFKPVWSFIDIENYTMRIRNRWGQLIFETHDPGEGWDGSYNGKIDSEVYVYTINYRASDGTEVERRGTVTVLQ